MEWMIDWNTAIIDPNIRTDGKQLASEIGLTLINCDTLLRDHDKLTLTRAIMAIDTSIDHHAIPDVSLDHRIVDGYQWGTRYFWQET
jgi:hypothetical protein